MYRIYFNPRSHEGSDFAYNKTSPTESIFQSTLPRRERPLGYRNSSPSYNFNPRSHEGSDVASTAVCSALGNFNPRSHEGSDAVGASVVSISADFNPRSHEGSDTNQPNHSTRRCISIHAPTKGATCLRAFGSHFLEISIHAPTKGATRQVV